MPSLKDIANDLDVSVSLVSKVLNNRLGTTGARPELVKSIQRKAAEMNYQRNTSALALLKGRQDVIGVFIHQVGKEGSNLTESLLRGLSSETTRHRQRQLLDFFITRDDFMAFGDIMHPGVMDGVIVGGLPHEELVPALLALQEKGLPVVTLHDRQMHPLLPNVALDNVEVGRLATEHLVERGCRNIAHVADLEERLEGYRLVLAKHNLPYEEARVYQDGVQDYSFEKGRRAAEALLKSGVPFDGLVAQSDEEAAAAVNIFCDAGLRIPEDVRVIGVDNAPYCEFMRVPLSSVSQSGRARGRTAVNMLMDLLNEKPVSSTMVEPVLCPRRSTAQARRT